MNWHPRVPCRPFLQCLLAIFLAVALRAAPGDPIKNGDIRSENTFYSVVFYYLSPTQANSLNTAKSLVEEMLPQLTFISDLKLMPKHSFVGFEEESAPFGNFPVPEASYFERHGFDLSPEAISSIQKSPYATCLIMVAPREHAWDWGKRFTELALAYAKKTNACIWDSATRECFSPDAWEKRRLQWPDSGAPEIRKHITIHIYRHETVGGYTRAATLGMEKFALPDLVIEKLVGSDSRSGGNLINLVSQLLAQNPEIQDGARSMFAIKDLQSASLREEYEKSFEANARGTVTLALLEGKPQDGDADNALVEIDFRNGDGNSEDEKRNHQLATLWGATDSITYIKHDDAIKVASRKAKKQLVKIRADFSKGLEAGARLLVKAPFADDKGGTEWMWVEVLEWPPGTHLTGTLQNDPFHIAALKAGAKVQVTVSEIFDYILYHPDGSMEGNETGKLILKQKPDSITK